MTLECQSVKRMVMLDAGEFQIRTIIICIVHVGFLRFSLEDLLSQEVPQIYMILVLYAYNYFLPPNIHWHGLIASVNHIQVARPRDLDASELNIYSSNCLCRGLELNCVYQLISPF